MGEDVAVAVTIGAGAAQAVNSRARDKIRSWMDFMMMLSELGRNNDLADSTGKRRAAVFQR